MSGPEPRGPLDSRGKDARDPGQMGPLLAGDTRPMGDEPADPIAAGHETAEVRVEPAVRFLVGLGLSAVLIFALVYGGLVFLRNRAGRAQPKAPPLVSASRGRLPPEPRLQITPVHDYQVFHAAQESLLNSYGWVNRDSLVVRIPIEAAMDLLVRRGLPFRSGAPREPGLEPIEPITPPPPSGEETDPVGRLPRGDLRLRPPNAPVVPAPGRTGGQR